MVEVCSRGMIVEEDLEKLRLTLHIHRREVDRMAGRVIRTALLESLRIWCSRLFNSDYNGILVLSLFCGFSFLHDTIVRYLELSLVDIHTSLFLCYL